MACTIQAPCGGTLVEDQEYARDAQAQGIRKRLFRCLAGHTHLVTVMGRPPKGRWQILVCAACGRDLTRYLHPMDQIPARPYCDRACRNRDAARRAIRTDQAAAVRLYAAGFSMVAVARLLGCGATSVQRALRRAGVQARRHSSTVRCVWRACGKPPWKRLASNGAIFGRRCRPHELRYLGRRRAGLSVPA